MRACTHVDLIKRTYQSHVQQRQVNPSSEQQLDVLAASVNARELVSQTLLTCTAVEQLVLQPIKRIEGHVKLPGSKSLSNRILLLAALSDGVTEVQNLLVSDCYVQSSEKSW